MQVHTLNGIRALIASSHAPLTENDLANKLIENRGYSPEVGAEIAGDVFDTIEEMIFEVSQPECVPAA